MGILWSQSIRTPQFHLHCLYFSHGYLSQQCGSSEKHPILSEVKGVLLLLPDPLEQGVELELSFGGVGNELSEGVVIATF